MPIPTEPTLPKYVTNTGLFHDHFLLASLIPTLPLHPDEVTNARAVSDAQHDAALVLTQIQSLWHERKTQLDISEANGEDFVAEVCRMLGMAVSSQGSVPREGTTTQRVDLTLFADNAVANDFAERTKQQQPAGERYARALAVVEVEKVYKNLNPNKATPGHPTRQIVDYLTFTGVPWGILTDGLKWRIFRRFDPPRFDQYLEINLATILNMSDQTNQQEAFWWFYAMVHRDALNRHERTARLDALYTSSQSRALEEQDSLRDQAFRVVEELAQGIYATHSSPDTADLELIYEQAIVILYRLLFLKFAEDKELLPIHHPQYQQEYGYRSIEERLLSQLDAPTITLGKSAASNAHWNRLKLLFANLNTGNEEIGIFPYNGGLFGDTYIGDKPIRLTEVTIPDSFLAQAIVHLARISHKENQLRVNYRTLQPRHLGSIYEGLLEQHLERHTDTVQLVSTAGEQSNQRRTSGSYYTPDYIVQYIVNHTIDPRCTGKTAKEIAQIQVLDPSMGSGHFLVTALYRLAQHHAQAKKRETINHPERMPMESDAQFADRNRAYDAQTTPTDDDIAISQRELVEHCIYGVDLNPLAVELAKLALWLSTLSKNRALSFLDHHLRVGNSLVGASMKHVGSLATMSANGNSNGKKKNGNGNGKKKNGNGNGTVYQMGLFEQIVWRVRDTILSYFYRIADLPSTTSEQIHQKEQEYAHFREYSRPFRQVANLWVSSYFGNAFTSQQAVDILEAIDDCYADPPDRTKWNAMETQPWFLYAQKIAATKEHNFFHWELEFPQIFLREEKGFDAVVGNPPYIRIQHISPAEVAYFSNRFLSPSANYDIYLVFIEHALTMVKQKNPVGFIVPHKFITTAYGKKLCRLLSENYYVDHLVHFGDVQVFAEAINYVCLLFVRNEHRQNRSTHYIQVEQPTTDLDALPVTHLSAESFQGERWILAPDENQHVMDKLKSHAVRLGTIAKPHRCLFTGLNEAFVVSEKQVQENNLEKAIVKPLLRGQDVQRWSVNHQDLSIIYPYTIEIIDGIAQRVPVDLADYPFVYQYLLSFKKKLVNRIEFTKWIKDDKIRDKRFFEYLDPRHPDQFESPKLLVPDIKDRNAFVFDTTGLYALNVVYTINLPSNDTKELLFLNALLNAKALDFFFKEIGTQVQNGFYRYTTQYLEQLPIRRIHFTTPAEERTQRGSELIAQVERATNATSPLELLQDVAVFRASDLGHVFAALLPMDDTGQFLAFHDGATGAEEHSDVVHDVLAHLAQRMVDLNQQRHQQQTDMLTDIQGVMGQRVWESLGKTQQLWNPRTKKAQAEKTAKHTLGPLYDEILTIEHALGRITRDQFTWLLDYKLGTVDNLSKLLKIYDQYHPAIATLNHQIAATDAIIDQIVYLLYGLTVDEVAVIEAPRGETV